MKKITYLLHMVLIVFGIISCDKKINDITGIGINAIQKEFLSSKIDSNYVIKLTNNSLGYQNIEKVEIKSPNGVSWGIVDFVNGSGTILLKRDTLDKYALKNGANYVLTNNNEIQIPNINFISINNLKASSTSTLLISPSVLYTLNADIISATTHIDTTKLVGSIIQNDSPIYFRYQVKSSDIDNPNYKLNLIISLISQNNGSTTLRKREYSSISDTIIIRGADYNVNDKISIRIRCATDGGLADDVSSAQFTVTAWTFQNSLTNRTLQKYFNLSRGIGSDDVVSSPHLKYNGNGSISLISNNDTTVTAVKFNGYRFDSRFVNDVKDKYNSGVVGTTFDVSANEALGIRYAYKNPKGIQTYSWAVVYVNAVGNPTTLEDNITFGYQYRPQTY